MTMQLSPDFNALIDVCSRRGVRFLIVSGDALAAHGHPRMAQDLAFSSRRRRRTPRR